MKKQTEQEFTFNLGRMVKGISSLLLKEGQVSDTQNMIPGYQGWKQRKGSTPLTTTAAIAASLRFKSLHQFRDLKGWTNVMMAHVYDSVNGERAMKQSTLPPTTAAGSSWVEMYDFTASCEKVQWATVAGALIGANNKEFVIWRGEQHWPTGVWTYLDTLDDYVSVFDEMIDGDTSTTASLSSFTIGDYLYVMHDQPMSIVSPDKGTANATTSWLIGEYYNGTWQLLKSASWWSTTELLDDDCTTIGAIWTDQDALGGDSTQTTFYGRECFKLDSGTGTGAGTYARLNKDVGSYAATTVVSVMAYLDDVGTQANSDGFAVGVDNGTTRLLATFASDGLFVYDGAAHNEVGTNVTAEDEWHVWTFEITWSSETCNVYKDGVQIGTDVDMSAASIDANGTIFIRQSGQTTPNQISYVTQVSIGTTLDTTADSYSDGTSASSKTLAQDGDISWTPPSDEVTYLIDGQEGYAVRFSPNKTISASTSIEAMDVYTPMDTVANIWDGMRINCNGAYVFDGTDYTDYVIYCNNTSESQYMDLSSVGTGDKVYVGFRERVRRIIFYVAAAGKNTADVSISTVKYHNTLGTATTVGDFTDTTETSDATMSQKGYVEWVPPDEGQEKPLKIGGDDVPWYWYEITFDASLGATTYVYYIEGVPVPESIDYSYGCFGWKRRAWQIAPYNRENQVRYSAQNMPNVFNGADSGYIEFGERPLRAAAPFYNETVLFADTEMWMLQGSNPSDFGRLRLSAQIGTCSPQSVITIETGVSVGESIKNVTVWMFYDGIWLFDGVRVMKISAPDIDSFFDPDHDDYINPTYLDQCYATYHHDTQCAYFVVYSGSSATTPTKVIVLHFPTLWYGILDYYDEFSTIDSVWNNKYYLVGGGHSTGFQYLLDTGVTDTDSSGTARAVTAFVVTRDMFMSYSEGMKQRLVSVWTEAQEAGGQVEIAEYPDGSKTPTEVAKASMSWYGRLFGIIQKTLKIHSNQITTKFRIQNQSKNARMNVLGFSATTDKGRTDEQ